MEDSRKHFMTRDLTQTHAAFQKSKQFFPCGVNSNFRYWSDEDTLVIARGQGGHIWDMDENRYIDYRLAFGPIILGHAHPAVIQRVREAIGDGTAFAWTTPWEIRVAERFVRMTGCEKMRLCNTGTEATMHALRIARGYTGREKFIKFEGHYHGMHDYALFSTASTPKGAMGSRRSPINAPVSSGIPKGMTQYVINLPFNDFETLERTVTNHWQDLAAIILEPTMGNVAGIMPEPGWLEHVRALCDTYGIVLIFDEVKTGFRIANGGAQEYFGIRADLATYAKAMGNGFPIAAIGGKAEVMDVIAPGAVAHGGTYIGNVAGTAAADATLEILENTPVIQTINARGQRLMDGIDSILTRAGILHAMTGIPPMFGYSLGTDKKPTDFRTYQATETDLYEKIAMALVERGVLPDSDGREPWFMCYAHSEQDIDDTLTVFEDAVKAVR